MNSHNSSDRVGSIFNPPAADTAVAFLRSIDATGRHNLVSIDPETKQIQGRTFEPESWPDIRDWIDEREGKANLYWSVNEPAPGAAHSKLAKGAIASIRALYVDLDPADGLPLAEARAALQLAADDLARGELPPTITLDSGGGYQFFWQLREKLPAEEWRTWAEHEGRGLGRLIGGDAVHDVARIMRLPGTLNLPDAKKRERGRSVSRARILSQLDRLYDPTSIGAVVAPKAAPEHQDHDAAIVQAHSALDIGLVEECQTGEPPPASTLEKFSRAYAADRKLRALWDGAKEDGDISASGYLASLASAVAVHDFTINDFGTIAAIWPRTNDEKTLSARSLARSWARLGEPATPRHIAQRWFEHLPDAPTAIEWLRPSDWIGKEPRPREWEVEGWIPRGEVTLLYGDGGTGKTLLAHQYATCAAAGLNWLGQPTRRARVMCFFCEDSEDELHRRQIDINRAYGVTLDQLDDRLRIVSRKYADNLLAVWDRSTGAMKRQAVWDHLLADALAFRADVIIVDTIADTYGGSEIDRIQVNSFVKSCLGRLAHEIGGSALALGHPSAAGLSSGQGTSGSTAWNNAVRSRLYLRFPEAGKGARSPTDIRELEGMKANYGPKGSLLKLRWAQGCFSPIAGSTPSNSTASFPSLADAAENAVINALIECGGIQLSKAPNSPYYGPRVLQQRCPEAVRSLSVREIEEALAALERRGAIRQDVVGKNSSRHPIQGYVIVPDKLSGQALEAGDVFN